MGRCGCCGDSGMVHPVVIAAALLLPLPAIAAKVVALPTGVTKSGGAWTVTGNTVTIAGGNATSVGGQVSTGGKVIQLVGTAALSSNAASIAWSFVRANPTVIGVSAAAWAASYGLSYYANQWMKAGGVDPNSAGITVRIATPHSGAQVCWGGPQDWSCYQSRLQTSFRTLYPGATVEVDPNGDHGGEGCKRFTRTNFTSGNYCNVNYRVRETAGGSWSGWQQARSTYFQPASCPSGTSWNGSACITPAAPATEAQLSAPAAGPLPDAAAQEVARQGAVLPVQEPALNPAPTKAPLSDPYIDPRTGKTVQPFVTVQPDATTTDPWDVDIRSSLDEIAPAPEPQPGDPKPVPIEEQPKDPCLENPDRLGCIDKGTPEDSELQTESRPFTITPVVVGGAGACPPPRQIVTSKGTFVMTWEPICNAAAWLNPLILAAAWLAAGYIIVGSVRGET